MSQKFLHMLLVHVQERKSTFLRVFVTISVCDIQKPEIAFHNQKNKDKCIGEITTDRQTPGMGMEQAPRGSGRGPKLLEFRECLCNTL